MTIAIKIEGQDHSIEFPEGTDQETIKRVLKQHFGKPEAVPSVLPDFSQEPQFRNVQPLKQPGTIGPDRLTNASPSAAKWVRENASIVGQIAKDALYGELPEGLGYLQKPMADLLTDLKKRPIGQLALPAEEEKKLAEKYPNLMAFRHATMVSIIPGAAFLTTPPGEKPLIQEEPELQRLEILAQTAVLGLAPIGIREASTAVFKIWSKIAPQSFKFAATTDLFSLFKAYFKNDIDAMKALKWGDERILRKVKDTPQWENFKQEAIHRRMKGESRQGPPAPPPEEPPLTGAPPPAIVPPKIPRRGPAGVSPIRPPEAPLEVAGPREAIIPPSVLSPEIVTPPGLPVRVEPSLSMVGKPPEVLSESLD